MMDQTIFTMKSMEKTHGFGMSESNLYVKVQLKSLSYLSGN